MDLTSLPVPPLATQRQLTPTPTPTSSIVPTAVVIKNIPFSLRRDSLLSLLHTLSLPLPYAFNYHFDNGVFRGLSFANFNTEEEARRVVEGLDGYEIMGRGLRVEFKRCLPVGERERVEREKRERRMMLSEKQSVEWHSGQGIPMHAQMAANGMPVVYAAAATGAIGAHGHGHAAQGSFRSVDMTPQSSIVSSMSNMSLTSQSSTSNGHHQQQLQHSLSHHAHRQHPSISTSIHAHAGQYAPPGLTQGAAVAPSYIPQPQPQVQEAVIDMNDAATLALYSQLILFRDDPTRTACAFSPLLTHAQRTVLFLLANKLGLEATEADGIVVVGRIEAPYAAGLGRYEESAQAQTSHIQNTPPPLGSKGIHHQRLSISTNITPERSPATASGLKSTRSLSDLRAAIAYPTPTESASSAIGTGVNVSAGGTPTRQPKGPDGSKGFVGMKKGERADRADNWRVAGAGKKKKESEGEFICV
ncbi:Peptidyl-prolyl cis-trans isomerase pin4 [Saitoella coloradoensis]